jgi:xanthine dehydrogenase small subunit
MSDGPHIVLNGEPRTVDAAPTTTLLDWLRGPAGLHGTKEGCAEGDCGACTVVLERANGDGSVRSEAVNSCMVMLGQVDGAGVRTVEGLAAADGALHPVQAAYVETGGTQCGFCTPGFVMATYAYAAQGGDAAVAPIHDMLAGNLCRCTGYRSIVAAVQRAVGAPGVPVPGVPVRLPPERAADAVFQAAGARFFAPRSLASALALRAAHPEAQLLAGGTDLGIQASRDRNPPATVIHLAHVPELQVLDEAGGALTIGAAITYSDALGLLARRHPALHTYLTRLGSTQIRNLGTIGGNLGTASPIGDTPPVLLALDAELTLASLRGVRRVALDGYFRGYRQTALAPDEIILSIRLPALPPCTSLAAEKVSKRRDQDISAVAAAFRITLLDGKMAAVRLAYGGVAATPVRARHAEAALEGQAPQETAFAAAVAALADDIAPLSDWRGRAEYRRLVAGNLLHRLRRRLVPDGAPVDLDAL